MYHLPKQKHLLIHKAEKGNVVFSEKNSYANSTKEMIWDENKFERINIEEGN